MGNYSNETCSDCEYYQNGYCEAKGEEVNGNSKPCDEFEEH